MHLPCRRGSEAEAFCFSAAGGSRNLQALVDSGPLTLASNRHEQVGRCLRQTTGRCERGETQASGSEVISTVAAHKDLRSWTSGGHIGGLPLKILRGRCLPPRRHYHTP